MSAVSGPGTYRRLLSYLARQRLIFALAVFAVALDAAGQGLFFYLLRPLVDNTIVNPDPSFGWWLPALVLLSVVVRIIGNFGGVFGMEWVGRTLIADLRRELFARYLDLPAENFDRESSGQMISRLTYNAEQVAQAATTALIGSLRDLFTVLALVTVMLIQSWRLTLAMLLLVPVIGLVVTVISRRFRKISGRIQDSMGDVTHVTEEAVNGHEVIRIFGGQAHEREAFERINADNRRLHLRLSGTQLLSSSMIQLAAGLAVIVLLVIAASEYMQAEVTAGIFMSVLAAMVACIPPLKRLTRMHVVIEKGLAAADSIFQVLDTPAEPDPGTQDPGRVRGAIEFEGVGFHYPDSDEWVLSDIDLKLEPGSVTALVGRSGSGKSTLVRLLPRFYAPQRGSIRIDGLPLTDFRLDALRRQIALVSQDVVLFNDTVAGNIAYGALAEVSHEQIVEAARQAHALEFIERLPQGFDTPIGEDGSLLSGGQRQRLAIARALLKDAPILVLDEATSALDAESERKVQQALEALMANRTSLVIAHRLATVKRADRVVVLDQGRIVEQGSHEELLARPEGLYHYLHRLQFQDAEQ
ncbi:lipid A export permease/ATP-binding protein MsbA [Wenzhouxiangella marina]|uniref:ATP-binding protein n=1 Tax=Wenzhouxiangella marina TaxID=1579979 RepID=A0A0K0XWY8_9GAMM|nr:lipid A export permease/ATP-binding protein MsbA [Wenzhouxiangella marina]AKS42190.1 ATP-binding protein [Wenzhouxiangella marina]MBB6086038.1 subfamily B ATP-binding cassette protein MsbA [Wenzhouxiangella marina]